MNKFNKTQVSLLLFIILFSTMLPGQQFASPEDSLLYPLKIAKDDTSKIIAYLNLANYCFYNDMKRGKMLVDSATMLASRQEGIHFWQILYYQCQSVLYYRSGEIVNAYKACLQFLKTAEYLGLKEAAFRAKGYIGFVHSNLGDYEKGAKMIEEGIKNLENIGSHKRTPTQYTILGETYAKMPKSAHLAIPTLRKALEILDKYPDKITEIRALIALIQVCVAKDSVGEVKYCVKRLQAIGLIANDLEGRAYVSLARAKILMSEDKLEEAEQLIQQFLTDSRIVFHQRNLIIGYGELKKLYQKKGDYKKTLYYDEQIFLLEDTILHLTRTNYAHLLEIQYENEKNQIALDQKQFKINQAEKLKWSLILGAISLMLLIILLYRQNEQKQKAYQHLEASSETIKQQTTSLELLMRELHHRVKNNLQVISSLLSLQAFRARDAAMADAIREGQNRVDAMSLIHQRLYKTHHVNTVDFKQYITDLVEKLRYVYGFSDKPVDSSIEISPRYLDADSAIPLGLILNELLTNTFKYGFAPSPLPPASIFP